MQLVDARKKVDELIAKNQDLIGDEAKRIQDDMQLQRLEDISATLSAMEEDNRNLNIGIIGRVKAGKSSLLNSLLFDGQTVLPKSATPMTAALTVISHGESLSADVEFYDRDDISDIQSKHAEYLQMHAKEVKKQLQEQEDKLKHRGLQKPEYPTSQASASSQEKADRAATRAMKSFLSLTAAYEQYEKIKSSGLSIEQQQATTLHASTLENLGEKMMDYVGAAGRYMPLTKSVHIKIPQENIKGLHITDTPGVNDPVLSREARTQEELHKCDVVLIVSPAGQFLSKEDTSLMDRITGSGGIRELYIIASQVDLQLFGHIYQQAKGDLYQGCQLITSELAKHLYTTIAKLKENHPEVGSTFDSFLQKTATGNDQNTRVIFTSSICESLSNTFLQRASWDKGQKIVWSNLSKSYPDFFSENNEEKSGGSLRYLSNIPRIKETLEKVREKKGEIIARRRTDYLEVQQKALREFIASILKKIGEQITEIETTDLAVLENQIDDLNKQSQRTIGYVNSKYADLVTELDNDLYIQLLNTIENAFDKASTEMDRAESTRTEQYEVSTSKLWNPFSWGSSEKRHREKKEVRAASVRHAMKKALGDIEGQAQDKAKILFNAWDKRNRKEITSSLRQSLGDDALDANTINIALGRVFSNVTYPAFNNLALPDDFNVSGTLTGYSAEEFMDKARDYVLGSMQQLKKDCRSYVIELIHVLKGISVGQSFVEEYQRSALKLKEQINNKNMNLTKYARLKADLQEVM